MVDSSSLGKEHCVLDGWSKTEGGKKEFEANGPFKNITEDHGATATLYAVWKQVDYNIGFDVDSEPGDEDYAGEPKDDQTVNVESGPTVIEDPKRPGYVFQGWAIPDADGEHALDQDLVYSEGEGDDKKWYVDASKLPDYYEQLKNEEGKIELTARWTSVISVDVPSSATFYYDLVTDQSAEAHEAALSGTTSFSSKSQIDLRICGLESKKAAGADSLFSSGADSALLSVYPAPNDKAQTMEGAQQGPAGAKPATAVDFSLDDVVLERAFTKEDADAYKIPAGDDLTLAYRLNLSDAAKLDYDKILAMAEGDEAALSAITYTFATEHSHGYSADANGESFYIEHRGRVYGAENIKAAADCISALGAESPCYDLYYSMMETFMDPNDPDDPHGFVKLSDGSVLNVRLVDLHRDNLAQPANGRTKAGMTFEFVQCIAMGKMNSDRSASGGWQRSQMRTSTLAENGPVWNRLPSVLRASIVPVKKASVVYGGSIATTTDKLFLMSMGEKGSGLPDGPSYSYGGNVPDVTKRYGASSVLFWLRSGVAKSNACFWRSDAQYPYANVDYGVAPLFCI